jgi:hypothetical protein
MAENISQTQRNERRYGENREERRGGDRPMGGKEGRNPYPPKEIGGKHDERQELKGKDVAGKDVEKKEFGRTESNTSGRDIERDADSDTRSEGDDQKEF